MQKHLRAVRDRQIIAEYVQGKKMTDVASSLGVSSGIVWYCLRRSGTPVRHSRSYPRPGRHRIKVDAHPEAARLYQAGMTLDDVGAVMGASRSTVGRVLKKQGVPMSPHRKTTISYERRSRARRRYAINETAFDEINEESAYWVGMLMADGCVKERRGSFAIILQLSGEDGDHVGAFRKFLGSGHKISTIRAAGRADVQRLAVDSRRLAEALACYGVVPRKSLTATAIGIEGNAAFWRGVIDGDGSLSVVVQGPRRYPGLSLVGARPLMEQFVAFVRATALGCKVNVHSSKSIFGVRLAGRYALQMIRALYDECTVALPRKLELAQRLMAEFA